MLEKQERGGKKKKKAAMYSICTVNLLFSPFIINAPLSYVSSPDERNELDRIKQYMLSLIPA